MCPMAVANEDDMKNVRRPARSIKFIKIKFAIINIAVTILDEPIGEMSGFVLANISVTKVTSIMMPCNELNKINENEIKIAFRAR